MNQNLKHNQLKTNTAKHCALRIAKFSAVHVICPSMWTARVAYAVVGGGAV